MAGKLVPVERKEVAEKSRLLLQGGRGRLTNGDNDFEKQLDSDSEPRSSKPARSIKVTATLTGGCSRRQPRELPGARGSLITPVTFTPAKQPKSPGWEPHSWLLGHRGGGGTPGPDRQGRSVTNNEAAL